MRMICDKKYVLILAAALGLFGCAIFLLCEPVITYLYHNTVELPILGDIMEDRAEHPLLYYLEYTLVLKRVVFVLVKLALLLTVASATNLISQVVPFITHLRGAMTPSRAVAILSVIVLIGYMVALSTTPQINFGYGKEGLGYGHDGAQYGRIADDFVPFETEVARPFCYRILPSMLVFYLGMGTFQGFHFVNFICYVLSCFLMYRLLRLYKVESLSSIIGVGFFICLKFGLKFWLYYPVLTDLLLLGIILGAVSGKHLLYITCMTFAVFSRENLLALLPFHILCTFQRSSSRRALWPMLLNLIPVGVFILSRYFPAVQCYGAYNPLRLLCSWSAKFLVRPTRQVNVFLGHINSLGVLAVAPFLAGKTAYRFLRQHYCWCYFVLLNLALSIVGGADIDRFAFWQAPILIILMVRGFSCLTAPVLLSHLFILQVVWSELFIPWRNDVRFYLSRYAVHSRGVDVFLMELSCIVFLAILAVLYAHYIKKASCVNC